MTKDMLQRFEDIGERLGVTVEPYDRDGRFVSVVEEILDRMDVLDERIKALETP